MDATDTQNSHVNRRSLLVGTAAAAAAGSAAGTAEAASPGSVTWDEEFDVVIAGFGLAGCYASIEALDSKPYAKVLILEKAPEEHAGGNSRASGQSLWRPKPNKQALMHYQRKMSEPNPIPEDLLEYWADQLLELEPWIKDRAKEARQEYVTSAGTREMPEYGAEEAVLSATILPRPGGLWEAFKKNIDKRPVTVWYESPAVELVQDCESGEVFGLIVEQAGKRIAVRALGGVVMAVGGFENNMDMQRNYFGHDVYPFGTPYNTGDGIRMVQKAGADLWHMRARVQSGGIWPAIQVPEFDTVFMRDFQSREQTEFHSWIDVAADDRRFYDETKRYSATHHKEKRHGHYFDTEFFQVQPVHMIFDETVCKNFCLMMKWMTWNAAVHRYDWSEDNSAEVEKGWVLKADTLAGLAFKMGRNADQIIRTVDEYNEACRAGKDEAYGRHPDTLSPIENGPFYAVKIVGGIVCTSGGAKRNKDSEVLDYASNAIPGLYEAGNLGSFISHLYQNGAYLTEAKITGRTAGRNAVLRAYT